MPVLQTSQTVQHRAWIDKVRQRLTAPLSSSLPGREAQYQMAHTARKQLFQQPEFTVPDTHRKAAVLILLYPEADILHTVLILRSPSPYAHGSQISLPGGRYEESDSSLLHTALRETEEEIGIPASAVYPLGALTDLYIPVSNHWVFPFVGYLNQSLPFVPDPKEVAEVLTFPLNTLFAPEVAKKKRLPSLEGVWPHEVPYYDICGQDVWGATAMILSEWIAICRELPMLEG